MDFSPGMHALVFTLALVFGMTEAYSRRDLKFNILKRVRQSWADGQVGCLTGRATEYDSKDSRQQGAVVLNTGVPKLF